MSAYRYVICDVFSNRPLAGNQLAVFPDGFEIPESRLQPLAREINFSETVFVYPPAAGGHARVDVTSTLKRLRSITGMREWTAQYIACVRWHGLMRFRTPIWG